MGAPKPLRKPKPQNHTSDEIESIARRIFWEEAPRLQREIYEGEIKKLRESMEADFSRIWEAIERLIEAQHRTEDQLAALAEAQKRTEERLARLEQVVAALAEAQKRTEERLARLEQVVAALAEAQKRTHEEVQELKKHYRTLSNITGLLTNLTGRWAK